MYSIAYISRANETLTDYEIHEMLLSSERRNNLFGIKGILLFKDGNFLQVLEGDQNQIQELYDKICEDSRHSNIYEIFNTELRSPIFNEYNSKFNLITSSFELASLKMFLKRQKRYGAFNTSAEELEPFLGMNWLT
ncbi:hypothetical protein AAU57_06540 [Nonlabens sp. YIK11]|uniref:BLUF domain-containing protein n=1 Tax=Nonlabens sp. YIK11 TaxID=1453349 RepID=UPI0006DC7224|nr:BLUF domain-containing protein [Nonlabens sp. YIK11]KQC33015.1 hypothetical protein AAU57_06540 [Nonlabens sp. YIK11]